MADRKKLKKREGEIKRKLKIIRGMKKGVEASAGGGGMHRMGPARKTKKKR